MSAETTTATRYGCFQTVSAPAEDIEAAMAMHPEPCHACA